MFSRLEEEINDLVKIGAAATGTEIKIVKDKYNYLWLLLRDEQFEDLVATMHLASSTLEGVQSAKDGFHKPIFI